MQVSASNEDLATISLEQFLLGYVLRHLMNVEK